MNNIEIIASGRYLPNKKIENKQLASNLNITEDYIYKRTGIKTRFFSEDEEIQDLAIKSVENLIKKNQDFKIEDVDLIIVATTSTTMLMPGISYKIQEKFEITNCMCFDILAGCAGYINAFDLARNYISIGKVNTALIIGVDALSKFTDKTDLSTSIILSDGAGATAIKKVEAQKKYESIIKSDGKNGDILTCKTDEYIQMNGKEIYKYAVTETVKNIKHLLKICNLQMEDINYIVPHQSNAKIMNSIEARLNIKNNLVYQNIENIGNTFCASIPIAIDEMFENNLISKGDKVILIGYGGGLNTGSILLEI